MIRNFFRLALVFLAIGLLRYVFALISSAVKKSAASPKPEPSPGTSTIGHLRRDPVCGTYVAEASSIKAQVAGQTVHYCSAACRDKHLEQRST
jgi:YHS domain-containing protein